MRNLFVSVLILLIFTTCFSSNRDKNIASDTDKFIELKDIMSALERNDTSYKNIRYHSQDFHELEQFNPFDYYHRRIPLKKKYENIEALITNFDKNLYRLFKNTYGIEIDFKSEQKYEIYFPVLKYENRVLLKIHAPYNSHVFVIELNEPKKVRIALVYAMDDTPAFYPIPPPPPPPPPLPPEEEIFWKINP